MAHLSGDWRRLGANGAVILVEHSADRRGATFSQGRTSGSDKQQNGGLKSAVCLNQIRKESLSRPSLPIH